MRSILTLIILLSLSLTTISNIKAQENKNVEIINYKNLLGPMPHFKIKAIDGKIYTEKDFKEYNNIILVIFNPTCDHCIEFGKSLATEPNLLKNTVYIFIGANGVDDYLKAYLEETGLNIQENKHIRIGTDQTPESVTNKPFTIFLTQVFEHKLPQVNIYNKDRKLIFKKSQDIQLDDIKRSIQ